KLRESILDLVQVTFFVFRFDREERRFGAEPIFSESLAMPADALLDVGAYGWVTFSADYDGDGRPDFATYDSERRLLVGRKGEESSAWFRKIPISFDDEPLFEIPAELSGPFFGQDINGDGRAELISCTGDHALIVEPGR
ncbi:MAG: VCBS repeat-containing protein, partial [Planctomycetota bacterium]